MKLRIKKLIIVLFVTLSSIFILIESIYLTREPIYLVTDSIYYSTTIKYQKTYLKFKALSNGKRIKYIVDEKSDGSWLSYDYKKGSKIILSPYLSLLYSVNDSIKFSNDIISIDKSCENELLNAQGDYLSGFEKLATILKEKKANVFLISSKAWPLSDIKAKAFKNVFTQEGLTEIKLEGSELEQKAYDLVDMMNKEKNVDIVSTGSLMISYFDKIDNNFKYSLEAYQVPSVDKNSIHYVLYEDLSPLLNNDNYNKENLVLKIKIKNNQEGLINFFLHLGRDLQSLFF
ncbi:MAG: hypothetical protein EOL97_03170 [Spirochaetia bacterium]|nr:hypothetical protein [Spirochaetia bacterium]